MTVDHGLQPGSADRAERTAALLRNLGLAPVPSSGSTSAGDGGPEGAARSARYEALPGRAAASTAPASPWGTPSTTRPRPCCSDSAAAPGRGRSPAWSTHRAPFWRPLLGDPAGDDARRLRRPGAARLGRPVERRPGLHPGAAAGGGAAAARGRPRRRRRPGAGAHRRAAARGPRRCSTSSPARTSTGWPTGPDCPPGRWPPCPPRCAGGCSAAGCTPPRCRTSRRCTWPPSTRLLTGVAGPGSGRPTGRRRRRPDVWHPDVVPAHDRGGQHAPDDLEEPSS